MVHNKYWFWLKMDLYRLVCMLFYVHTVQMSSVYIGCMLYLTSAQIYDTDSSSSKLRIALVVA